jgi:hypothetical protein
MKFRIETVCADYHAESFIRFKGHMMREDRSVHIDTDWREMDYWEEFDLVLGDLAFTMVGFRDWGNVAKRISRALKTEGRAIQRIWLRLPGKYSDFEYLIREHRTRKGMHPFKSFAYPFFQHFVTENGSIRPDQGDK